MNGYYNYKDELYHHGVLGMKWGVRRYQSYSENPKLSDRKDKKAARLQSKIEKRINRNTEQGNKYLERRQKRAEKLSDKIRKRESIKKYNVKLDENGNTIIDPVEYDSSDKKLKRLLKKQADYNYRTNQQVKQYNAYNKIMADYGNAKISSIYDESVKYSEQYKKAIERYGIVTFGDWYIE